MKFIVIAAIVAFLTWLIFRFKQSEAKRGRFVFELATSLEKSGKYEDACFHYAVAANAGHEPDLCHKKIKDLWSSFGPFDFSEQLKKLKSEYCRDESCGEGFHYLTVSDIYKWVGKNENTKCDLTSNQDSDYQRRT